MGLLISFDIDGTLETGDPPGPLTMDMVRRVKELGAVIGSCSDRSATSQQALWDRNDIEPDFIALKHRLEDVKTRFDKERYIHIGDRDLDQQYALKAGFEFLWPDEALTQPWLTGDIPQL